MKGRRIAKLIAFNLCLLGADVLVFAVLGISPLDGPPLRMALGITAAAASVVAFLGVNYRLMSVPPAERVELIEAAPRENYRATLSRFHSRNAQLMELVGEAVEQLDSIEQKHNVMREIIQRNHIQDNGDLGQAYANTEAILYNNTKSLLNRLAIWNERESLDPDRAALYRDHIAFIRRVLEHNERILIQFDRFLVALANTDTQVIEDDMNLNAYIRALETMNAEDGMGGKI